MAPGKRLQHDPEKILEAIESVNSGKYKLREASRVYGIPYGTLSDKLRGRRPIHIQSKKALKAEDENKLVDWLAESKKRGFGYSKDNIKRAVKNVLDTSNRTGPFRNNIPGHRWLGHFLSKHKALLSQKRPQPLAAQTPQRKVTEARIQEWFSNAFKEISEIDSQLLSDPKRIYCCEELGFTLCPISGKVIAPKAEAIIYQETDDGRQQICVLTCGSADGCLMHPCIIFPENRLPLNPLKGFPECSVVSSANGWVDGESFETWLRTDFIPQVKSINRPVVLFAKDHKAYMTLQVYQLCLEHDIMFYSLPSHRSLMTQPLELVLKSLRAAWIEAAYDYQERTACILGKDEFTSVFKEAWTKGMIAESVQNGFKAAGLFPWAPSNIVFKKATPAPVRSTKKDSSPETQTLSSYSGTVHASKALTASHKSPEAENADMNNSILSSSSDHGNAQQPLQRWKVSTKRSHHDPHRIQEAIDAVKNKKMSLRETARLYKIPYTTLGDKIRGKRPIYPNWKRALSAEDENKLVEWVIESSRQGCPCSKDQIRRAAKGIIDASSKDSPLKKMNKLPGCRWLEKFMARHKDVLTQGNAQLSKSQRVTVTEADVRDWFDKTFKEISRVDPEVLSEPDRIFTCDELEFSICPQTEKVIAPKRKGSFKSKQQITVLCCGSAEGSAMHPLIVFPGRYFAGSPMKGFQEASFGNTDCGWMDGELFEAWLKDHFLPYAEHVKRPLVLFVTESKAFVTTDVHHFCQLHNIILVTIPLNMCHIIQPLELTTFKSLKAAWKNAACDFQERTSTAVGKQDFASVLKSTWVEGVTSDEMKIGFTTAGLFPWDTQHLNFEKMVKPSNSTCKVNRASAGGVSATSSAVPAVTTLSTSSSSLLSLSSSTAASTVTTSQIQNVIPARTGTSHSSNYNSQIMTNDVEMEYPALEATTLDGLSYSNWSNIPPNEPSTNSLPEPNHMMPAQPDLPLPLHSMESSFEHLLEITATVGLEGLARFKTCIDHNYDLNDPQFRLFRQLYLNHKKTLQTGTVTVIMGNNSDNNSIC